MNEASEPCVPLWQRFSASVTAHPDRLALEVDGERWTYAVLSERARAVAGALADGRDEGATPTTLVVASGTYSAFVGILGAGASGHAYVPVQPAFPPARIVGLFARSEAREVVVDAAALGHVAAMLAAATHPTVVVSPEVEFSDAHRAAAEAGGHRLVGPAELAATPPLEARAAAAPDDLAYLMFTSGSTGEPKGVGVTQANVSRFLDVVIERYALGPEDRFTHLFELTFDLSVFDLFASWSVGGCLCVPGPRERLLPAAYVRDAEITIWFSVPSTALLMKKTRLLEAGALPSLRVGLFCGEALPVSVAETWLDAAPNATSENLYGPTELTLACTWHPLLRGDPDAVGGVVPIGAPFPGMRARVVDDALREVAPGETGELIMAGPQRVPGYWRDPERTAAAFVVPPGTDETYYRTGDLVRRPTAGEPMCFLGRVDSQIKVRGYRVELGEIEAAIRDVTGLDAAVALGWSPTPDAPPDAIVAFIDDADVDRAGLKRELSTRLPRYMVPREIRVVDEFPLNVNAKIDRKALAATLR